MRPDLVMRLPFALTESSVLAVIPARFQSSRFPGKPLADIAGRPMIEHVYRRTVDARSVDAVVVATDDERIASAVAAFGGVALMTQLDHATGTDRIAEVASALPCRLVVNVQGDEPLIDPSVIDLAIAPLMADPSIEMGTLGRPLRDQGEYESPQVVKVVTDLRGRALYFSRAPIPHRRNPPSAGPGPAGWAAARAHVGLYVYRRDVLLRLAALPEAPLERLEALEQLRALEHGIGIHVTDTSFDSVSVDTPDDLDRVRQRLLAAPRT